MKIFINKNNEIKAINETTLVGLTEITVDRNQVFGNMSDFMILNYKYAQDEYGYSVTPARDYNTLLQEEKDYLLIELNKDKADLLLENAKLKVQLANTGSTLI